MEELNQSIKDVIKRFDGFEHKMTEINSTIAGLKDEVQDYKKEMSARVNSIETQIEKIQKR